MKKILLSIMIMFSTIFAVDFSQDTLYKADIDSQTAYNLQQKGAILIDVRTKREFEFAHPKDAINIPIFYEKFGQRVLNKDFVEQVDYLVKSNMEKEIILICRSGSRTKFAANILGQEGFSNIYNIKNGFAYDWSKTQLPISK
ncbi:rhodanese-like domain-containing protein [Malaciobacter mytili]|uniref:Rhodanese domain-containing protein n=1 Tax=Malaciobacter mytili LMG 24559 TaxID=1032238 RepID=A0AAX2AEK5_9BACT|nr:rhodanese-like domain-containing protein [Malaciobacter mytili]AXH15367.1 rhodanese-like domain-containing protein [Malaciobacter mytili LMG 24559]RXI43661.1 hypothetical protein CRU99_06935 [Malaciobacter mytili]RXK15353.1 hypothetical protein CP985_08875 [Malaciobacter mytili LMG 24559]